MARHSDEKSKLIRILEETPLINYACKKVGIGRTTFYRWMKSNLEFKRGVERALESGRSQWVEVAESSLMKNVKNGKMDAIKFFLSHNEPRYVPLRSVYVEPLAAKERREFMQANAKNRPLSPETKESILRAMRNFGILKDIEDRKEKKPN